MATTYNGNPASVVPNVTQTITEPADLDPATAASVNNPGPFQQLADIAAYVSQINHKPNFPVANLPAAATVGFGASGGGGTSHYSLLNAYIAGASNGKNIRFYYRTDDGAWCIAQNAIAGAGKWTADDHTKPACLLVMGGTLFPNTANGGFGLFYLDAPPVAGWYDEYPVGTGNRWTGDFSLDLATNGAFQIDVPTSATNGLVVNGPPNANAIQGNATGTNAAGVDGHGGTASPGVAGVGGAGGPGMLGIGGSGNTIGVYGLGTGTGPGVEGDGSGSGVGVLGTSSGNAPGVDGEGNGTGPGVFGRAAGGNYGVQGQGGPNFAGGGFTGGAGNADGVAGQATGNGSGVHGSGASGPGLKGNSVSGIGCVLFGNATSSPLNIQGAAYPGGFPSVPNEGDIHYDTTNHKLRYYDGSTWQIV